MVCALTLKESVDFALKYNPSVISSQKKLEAAQAKLHQAFGTFLPIIKLDGNLGKSYTQPSAVQITIQTTGGAVTQNYSFGTDSASDSKSVTTSLTQPLFVPALLPGLRIAQKTKDIASEDYRKTALDVSFNATQAYFGTLKAEKLVKLLEQSKDMAQSHLDQVKLLFGAGAATKADILRTEVQFLNSEVALTKAENGLEIAKNAFNNTLGRNLSEAVQLEEYGSEEELEALKNFDNLIKTAFENRPDWKQYLLSKQIGEESLKVAQAGYFPMVYLSGQTGNRITEYPTYKSDVNSWSIIGSATWTLFDGLGVQNKIKEAMANLESQKASEEQVKNGIILEVRDSFLNLQTALETISSSKKALESAKENYKVSDIRYKSGIGTNLEEIDAQVTLTQSNINYVQALYDLEIAKAKLNKVIGKEER